MRDLNKLVPGRQLGLDQRPNVTPAKPRTQGPPDNDAQETKGGTTFGMAEYNAETESAQKITREQGEVTHEVVMLPPVVKEHINRTVLEIVHPVICDSAEDAQALAMGDPRLVESLAEAWNSIDGLPLVSSNTRSEQLASPESPTPAFTSPIPHPNDPSKIILRNPWDNDVAILVKEQDEREAKEFFDKHVTSLGNWRSPSMQITGEMQSQLASKLAADAPTRQPVQRDVAPGSVRRADPANKAPIVGTLKKAEIINVGTIKGGTVNRVPAPGGAGTVGKGNALPVTSKRPNIADVFSAPDVPNQQVKQPVNQTSAVADSSSTRTQQDWSKSKGGESQTFADEMLALVDSVFLDSATEQLERANTMGSALGNNKPSAVGSKSDRSPTLGTTGTPKIPSVNTGVADAQKAPLTPAIRIPATQQRGPVNIKPPAITIPPPSRAPPRPPTEQTQHTQTTQPPRATVSPASGPPPSPLRLESLTPTSYSGISRSPPPKTPLPDTPTHKLSIPGPHYAGSRVSTIIGGTKDIVGELRNRQQLRKVSNSEQGQQLRKVSNSEQGDSSATMRKPRSTESLKEARASLEAVQKEAQLFAEEEQIAAAMPRGLDSLASLDKVVHELAQSVARRMGPEQ
ncbi:hypothetical protein BC832DRAFT_552714 [Gaertneriomyces semiglobifer]|nr:hypothetical protein BC832DRAFT_552714 [Gaertneriomyces semiglobifer]